MFAGIGSMHALVPPQMMLIDAGGAVGLLPEDHQPAEDLGHVVPRDADPGRGQRSIEQVV